MTVAANQHVGTSTSRQYERHEARRSQRHAYHQLHARHTAPGRCDPPNLLKARSIDTILVTGTVANVCCESSIRDAFTLGYRVIAVADALAAISDDDLNASLHTIYRSFGDVRTSTDIVELLDD